MSRAKQPIELSEIEQKKQKIFDFVVAYSHNTKVTIYDICANCGFKLPKEATLHDDVIYVRKLIKAINEDVKYDKAILYDQGTYDCWVSDDLAEIEAWTNKVYVQPALSKLVFANRIRKKYGLKPYGDDTVRLDLSGDVSSNE